MNSTVEKIKDVLTSIEANYSKWPSFAYSEAKPLIVNQEYAFTCLRYAEVVKKHSPGRYVFIKDHGLTPEQIHEKALKVMENNRKESTKVEGEMKLPLETEFIKEGPVNIPNVSGTGLLLNSNDTIWLTEEKAITFLKDLGYKILKPVKEFQEV